MNRRQLLISIGSAVIFCLGLYLFRLLLPDRFQQFRDMLEAVSFLVVLAGLPIGLVQYFRVTRKEQLDREYGTYNALDEKFLEFQSLCLAHPRLDIFDVPDEVSSSLSAEEQKQEIIAFTMLFSIFERAYLMYHDHSTEIKRDQWSGWDKYIQSFCRRGNFRAAWQKSGATFDKNFDQYIRTWLQ